MKNFVIILFLFALISCEKEEILTPEEKIEHALIGQWNVIDSYRNDRSRGELVQDLFNQDIVNITETTFVVGEFIENIEFVDETTFVTGDYEWQYRKESTTYFYGQSSDGMITLYLEVEKLHK